MNTPLSQNCTQARTPASTADEIERRVKERTADLEFFAHSVVHDLRASLRAIDGYGYVLQQAHSHALDNEGKRFLNALCNSVRHLSQWLDRLLTFSQLNHQPLEEIRVDMTALARGVYEELARLAPQRTIELKLEPLPPTRGDPVMLRQVFLNLLSNAFKFTEDRDVAVIEIAGRQQDGQCEYWVCDNGIGFDMLKASKLFRPFERLHDPAHHGGTGLGLAIVQRIIQRHGGRVWAQSSTNQGATFHFTTEAHRPCAVLSEADGAERKCEADGGEQGRAGGTISERLLTSK